MNISQLILINCMYLDIEHHLHQGRPVYQQRSATLNHNGSGQHPPSNEVWHRQSSVDLTPQHQGTSLSNRN